MQEQQEALQRAQQAALEEKRQAELLRQRARVWPLLNVHAGQSSFQFCLREKYLSAVYGIRSTGFL
jgi:hypothetical protein